MWEPFIRLSSFVYYIRGGILLFLPRPSNPPHPIHGRWVFLPPPSPSSAIVFQESLLTIGRRRRNWKSLSQHPNSRTQSGPTSGGFFPPPLSPTNPKIRFFPNRHHEGKKILTLSSFFVTYLFSRIKTDGSSFYTTLPFPILSFFFF